MRSHRWCHRRRAVRARAIAMSLGLSLALLAVGCSSTPEQAADDAQLRGPLPYHVGVYLDTERLPYRLPPGEPDVLKVRYSGDDEAILAMVKEAISVDRPVVSQVEILTARDLEEALTQAKGLDLLLAVGFETADEYRQYERSASWGALEVFAWIFGGFGSWFVPTVEYAVDATLTLESLDLHQPRVQGWYKGRGRERPSFDWPATFRAEPVETSLWDRSGEGTDYLLTIVVPPMAVVPGQVDDLSTSLTQAIHADLGEQMSSSLRDRLLSEDWVKPLTVVFVGPDPLALVEGDAISLDLSLAKREKGALRALEVMRLAPKADETYRWRASATDLEELGGAFAELDDPGGYVPYRVPQDVPIVPGANLVKVLLVHENGERAVRTMLYVK